MGSWREARSTLISKEAPHEEIRQEDHAEPGDPATPRGRGPHGSQRRGVGHLLRLLPDPEPVSAIQCHYVQVRSSPHRWTCPLGVVLYCYKPRGQDADSEDKIL